MKRPWPTKGCCTMDKEYLKKNGHLEQKKFNSAVSVKFIPTLFPFVLH
jgi:hypothetical protein